VEEESAAAGRPPLPDPPLGTLAEFALLGVAGALLAQGGVWFGWATQGGLFDGASQVLARKLFVTQAWWRLPYAVALGAALHYYWTALIAPTQAPGKAVAVLWGVVRAFIHFALFGMIALFGVLLAFLLMFLRWLGAKLRLAPPLEEEAGANMFARWMGVPIWFVILPFQAAGLPNEGDMTLPVTVARRALLRWVPAIVAALWLWTRMTSEESGEPVDPSWLAFTATYWAADFLAVALRVTPVLRARRGLPP
jgi:hypothetical protein